jgi:hypothetical protein
MFGANPHAVVPPVDVSSWTVKNPDGKTPGLSYDILKRRNGEREHSALTYVRAKLRCWQGPIDAAAPRLDLVTHRLLLPPAASDMFLSADMLWMTVDHQTDRPGDPHLLAGPTLWFPDAQHHHQAIRQAAEFAQEEIADRHGVAVHLVAHAPERMGKSADFHVHLLCTAREVTPRGVGAFVRPMLETGCQTRIASAWEAWKQRRPAG